jgi:hypothetical protein
MTIYFVQRVPRKGKSEYVAVTGDEKEAYRLQDEYQQRSQFGDFRIITKDVKCS